VQLISFKKLYHRTGDASVFAVLVGFEFGCRRGGGVGNDIENVLRCQTLNSGNHELSYFAHARTLLHIGQLTCHIARRTGSDTRNHADPI